MSIPHTRDGDLDTGDPAVDTPVRARNPELGL
jgi:hypothetical protein